MTSLRHLNLGTVPPYHSLFSTVTIVPPNTSLAYVSTQWAGDENGEVLYPNDYAAQSKFIWANIDKILKGLGCGMKDVVWKIVTFKDFEEDIGRQVVEGMMESLIQEQEHALSSSLRFVMAKGFHKEGIVYSVDLVVAVPPK